MKASFFRKVWIMLASAKYIFVMCVQAVWYGKRNQQIEIDKRLHKGSFKLLDLVRARVTFHGLEHMKVEPNERYIIMCNHSSLYDIPLSFMASNGLCMRMIAKKELSKIPIFAAAMRYSKSPSIDRTNLKQAIRDLEFAKKVMEEGVIIWISPEGGRFGEKGKLKKGGFYTAVNAKAKIIPMYITGAENILQAKTWDFYLDQEVDVHVLPHIDASNSTKKDIPELIEKVLQAWDSIS